MSTHSAPSVIYPLGRSRLQAGLLAGLWVAGLVPAALFLLWGAFTLWHAFAMGSAVTLSGLVALSSWKQTRSGHLGWDGNTWRWQSGGDGIGEGEQQLTVVADLQNHILLRLENQSGAALWYWAGQSALPERWLDFRRAVFSPRSIAPLDPLVDQPVAPSATTQR